MRIGTAIKLSNQKLVQLHPAFGLDEDWNDRLIPLLSYIELHPAFGLDEDWNPNSYNATKKLLEIASGFRAG